MDAVLPHDGWDSDAARGASWITIQQDPGAWPPMPEPARNYADATLATLPGTLTTDPLSGLDWWERR